MMPQTRLNANIRELLIDRWAPFLLEQGASPVALVSVVQKEGDTQGAPVLCHVMNVPKATLADLLERVAEQLRKQ